MENKDFLKQFILIDDDKCSTSNKFLRKALRLAHKNICFYCKSKLGDVFHVDHLIPKDVGGPDNIANYVPTCERCNSIKSAAFDPQLIIPVIYLQQVRFTPRVRVFMQRLKTRSKRFTTPKTVNFSKKSFTGFHDFISARNMQIPYSDYLLACGFDQETIKYVLLQFELYCSILHYKWNDHGYSCRCSTSESNEADNIEKAIIEHIQNKYTWWQPQKSIQRILDESESKILKEIIQQRRLPICLKSGFKLQSLPKSSAKKNRKNV